MSTNPSQILPAAQPNIGNFVSSVLNPTNFGTFKITFNPPKNHVSYAKISSVNAAYSQSLEISRFKGALAGQLFNFGGDGNIGKATTNWFKSTTINAPLEYLFESRNWYFGESRIANGYRVQCDTYEKGIWFKISIDDAGRWAHKGNSDFDYNDYIAGFVLAFDEDVVFSYTADRSSIIVY